MRRLRRTAANVVGPSAQLFAACATELGLRRSAALATHPVVRSPVTFGLLRPIVLVPPGWPELPEPVRRGTLLHELAHLARGDDWWAVLLELVRTVFFFHPLVWWLLNRIERERELLCDEAAVARGVDPQDYARMLLEFARRPGRLAPAGFVGLLYPLRFGKRRTVKARIHHLLEENMERWSSPLPARRMVALGCIVFGLALGLGSLRVRALPPKAPAATSEPKAQPPGPLDSRKPVSLPAEPNKPTASPRDGDTAKALYRIKPNDVLQIQVMPSVPGLPIGGFYLVEADGRVDLGPGFGKAALGGLTLNEATTAVVKQVRPRVKDPKASVALAGWVTKWQNDPARKNPYRVKPGQVLRIWAMPSLPGAGISGPYVVDPDGNVVLGPEYGKVRVAGLTLDQATDAISLHLARVIKAVAVSVAPSGWEKDWQKFGEEDGLSPAERSSASPGEEAIPPYRAKPYDVLLLSASPTLPGTPLGGPYLVYPDGKVNLGANYGKVSVDGLTLEKATTAVKDVLSKTVKAPNVLVWPAGRVLGWRSAPDPKGAYKVRKGEVLTVVAEPHLPDAPITGAYEVGADGMITLGPEYGKVPVAGLTIDQATEAISRVLRGTVRVPTVSVFPGRWDLLGARRRPPAKPPEAQESGREALRYDRKDFHQWRRELLTELKPDIRVEGLKALSAFGANGYPTEATRAALEAVRGYNIETANQDENRDAMKVLTAGLGTMRQIGPAAVPELRKAMKGENRNGRRFAIVALGHLGPDAKAAVPDLVEAIKDKDAVARGAALTAVAMIDPKTKEVVPVLLSIGALNDPRLQYDAIRILTALGPEAKAAAPALAQLIENMSPGSRPAAVEALIEIRPDPKIAVPALIAGLRSFDPSSQSLRKAIELLGSYGPDARAAVLLLNELLQRERLAGRQEGVQRTGQIRWPKSPEQVIEEALRKIDKR
jgi:protein involved in polysaccharide export with SLBB domain